jgi:hypothetical protein
MNQEESRQALEAESRELAGVVSSAIREAERSSRVDALVAPDVRNAIGRLVFLVQHDPPVMRVIDVYALAYVLYRRHMLGIAEPGEFAFGVRLFSDLSQALPDRIPEPVKLLLLARDGGIDSETYDTAATIEAAALLAEYGADAGDEQALDTAEALEQAVLGRLPLDHPHRAVVLNNLTSLMVLRSRRSGVPLDPDLLRTRADELLDAAEQSPYSIGLVIGVADLLTCAGSASEIGPSLTRTLDLLRRARASELEEGQRQRVLLMLSRLLSQFSDESEES